MGMAEIMNESKMKNVELEDGQSADIVSDNIEKMKELFPDAFSEAGVNFETLRQLLGDASVLEDGEEKYGLNWHGKKKARQIGLTPSTGTLLPCPDESVDWNTTKNLFIEGDNLEVLKLLQKSYANKVKVIYIDPPYNTGNEFVYPDKFEENLDTYLRYTGQKDEFGTKLSSNTEAGGRKHTNWLNMMLPRLKCARNILSTDGVVFISIDDNEQANLKELCDDVFGQDCFVSNLVWEKKKKGTFLSNTITSVKEYVLVYCKSQQEFKGLIGEINSETETYPCVNASNKRQIATIPAGIESKYREKNYVLKAGNEISASTMSLKLHSDLIIKDGKLAEDLVIEGNWRYRPELLTQYAASGELYLTQDLYLRRIVNEPREKTLKDLLPRVGTKTESDFRAIDPTNLFVDGWGSNEDGEEELRTILGAKGILDYPKPKKLIQKLIASVRDKDAVILDFFAGSGTTAQSVMELNQVDGGTRRFILVQLPEILDKSSSASQEGFNNIAEICKKRIEIISSKVKSTSSDLDVGFKVFKLSGSNIQTWSPDRTDIEESLLSHEEHLVEGRTEQDVLYELLLKRGVDLAAPIENREVVGKNIYSIGYGVLFACLDESIAKEQVEDIAQAIITWHGELAPSSDTHVFFRDSAFRDDVSKTNMAAILEQNGINHVRSL